VRGENSLDRDFLLKMKVLFDHDIAREVDALETLIIAHNDLAMYLETLVFHSALKNLFAELYSVQISVKLRVLIAPLLILMVRRNLVRGLSFGGYISILSEDGCGDSFCIGYRRDSAAISWRPDTFSLKE
jgi:hypothetical protein